MNVDETGGGPQQYPETNLISRLVSRRTIVHTSVRDSTLPGLCSQSFEHTTKMDTVFGRHT